MDEIEIEDIPEVILESIEEQVFLKELGYITEQYEE